jgi:hypothetical protein
MQNPIFKAALAAALGIKTIRNLLLNKQQYSIVTLEAVVAILAAAAGTHVEAM